MSIVSRRSFIALAPAGVLWGARAAWGQAGGPAGLVVVVHPKFPWADLGVDTLRAIFLGEPIYLPSGKRVLPLNDVAGAATRLAFDQKVLRMSGEQAGRYRVDRRIRGQGQPPRSVPSPALRQRLVAQFPEAISYVRAPELQPIVLPLKLNGKPFEARGYPLAGS